MDNSFNSNVEALLGKLENFTSTKTVVGEPIHINDVIILPLIEVRFGVAVRASDNEKDSSKQDNVGGGMGGTITPSAVLVINDGNVQLVNVKNQDSLSKLIDMFPGILSKITKKKSTPDEYPL